MKCMAIFPLPYGHYNRKDNKDRGSGQVDFVFDLQLFAGEKTEEPTAKRKQDALKKARWAAVRKSVLPLCYWRDFSY